MANNNSIHKREPSLQELANSVGVTQFPSSTSWNQNLGGLLIQGGTSGSIASDAYEAITFSVPYGKQVLGVFTQAISASTAYNENTGLVDNVTTAGFKLYNDGNYAKTFYWFAIGV